MKKIILVTFIAAGMIFLGIKLSPSAFSGKPTDNNALIHYQVNIHPDSRINSNACPLWVQLSDGSGMMIGQPQLYRKGTNTYHFYEAGPVSGRRVAGLTDEDEGLPHDVCIIISLTDSKSGTFYGGGTYIFGLFDSPENINVWYDL
jgi:hypothetical protein